MIELLRYDFHNTTIDAKVFIKATLDKIEESEFKGFNKFEIEYELDYSGVWYEGESPDVSIILKGSIE